jgi:nicotinate-nucleotide adenylyltransferase
MTRPGEAPAYSETLARALTPRRVTDPGRLAQQPAGLLLPIAVTPLAISSTAIRAAIDDPAALRRLLPRSVAEHIEREKLYR